MRKHLVWAMSLALAVAGTALVSCDSKGDSSTGPDTTTDPTPGATASYTLDIKSPAALDTTVPNSVTKLTIRGSLSPAAYSSLKIGGKPVSATSGGFTYTVNLVPGRNTFYLTFDKDTTLNKQIYVTRLLDAPRIVPVGATADARDFNDSVRITFVSTNGVGDSIRYSTNGATAKITGADPIVATGSTKLLNGTTTIKAVAVKTTVDGTVASDTTITTFTIGKRVAKPYFSTSKIDSSTVVKKISIGGMGINDTVRYTTDGGDPDQTSSQIYKDSIVVDQSMTIIAKSFRGNNIPSPACTTTISLNAVAPVFSLKPGQYTSQRYLSIKSASGIPVYYTTDGSTPNDQSIKYSDSLLLDSNVTINAIAIKQGWRSSKVVAATYTFKVATPNLSFRTGNYDTTQMLRITDSAANVSIHYTLDGSIPTCASTLYNADSLLRLDSNVVVKARGCRDGWLQSDSVVGNYTFKVAKIVFTPDSGIYRSYQVVTLNTRSPGVTFYVTRDSTTPSWDLTGTAKGSTRKMFPGDTMLLAKSQWLRVTAIRSGWANSKDDARRYIIEGDTLLVDDFEQNSLTHPIGSDWNFWACGYCVSTGIPNQMESNVTDTITDWNRNIGFRHGHISFQIPDRGAEESSDGSNGPGYAGYSVAVPSALMGETYRMVFWARWIKGDNSLPDSLPLVTEMVWKPNDNQNGRYYDGFHRRIDWIGPKWRRFILDYSAFYAAANAYEPTTLADSTNTKPRSYFIIAGYPDSAKMRSMGLSKFQGAVAHDPDWTPRWKWGADHDHWLKNDITNFRWSILQPSTDLNMIASLTHNDRNYRLWFNGTGYDTLYCGDCHQPVEPWYSDALKNTFLKNMKGSLELDRIQLVRRPQKQGGLDVPVVKTDTTTH